ncbi:MAG TPA: hypothetical protein VIL97_06160 [Thermoanaerobaculia bacterium]
MIKHFLSILLVILATNLIAQEPPALPPPVPVPPPQEEKKDKPPPPIEEIEEEEGIVLPAAPEEVPATEPAVPSQPAATGTSSTPQRAAERRDLFPNLDIYLPEGEFSLRTRKLARNVLFESQINYKFVDGDIETFLRYKYYAHDFTYKIGVFDTLEFPSLESGSLDFDRVRGGLVLLEYPVNYNRRYFVLLQGDFLRFSEIDNPDNDQRNVYAKFGYQFGTPFDDRLNAIVGETRGRRTPVLSAYREIGPQKLGLAVALTQGFEGVGDYPYTKFEAEGIKRFDIGETKFMISRLHLGSIFSKDTYEDEDLGERVRVPRYELIKLGGRDAMKGVDDGARGTDEAHLSNEFFFPIFRDRNYKMWQLRWNNLYGVAYAGAGSVELERDDDFPAEGLEIPVFGDVVVDVGLGFEASLTVRRYEVFLTAVYAQTVSGPEALDSDEVRFSVRTTR